MPVFLESSAAVVLFIKRAAFSLSANVAMIYTFLSCLYYIKVFSDYVKNLV